MFCAFQISLGDRNFKVLSTPEYSRCVDGKSLHLLPGDLLAPKYPTYPFSFSYQTASNSGKWRGILTSRHGILPTKTGT